MTNNIHGKPENVEFLLEGPYNNQYNITICMIVIIAYWYVLFYIILEACEI